MTTSGLERLVALLARASAKRGDFVLSSGKRSDFYVDVRLTSLSPEGLLLIGQLGLDLVQKEFPLADAVGGLTLGADPIACAIALTSATTERPLRAFTVRKESKPHGTGRLIEGPFSPGDRVVVLEDVITTGGSALRAADAVHQASGVVLGVLAVVDREEGGRERLEGAGLQVVTLVGRSTLVRRL